MKTGDKVRVKWSGQIGIIISTDLKRFPTINNGKQIRVYIVQMESSKIMEYQASDLKILNVSIL